MDGRSDMTAKDMFEQMEYIRISDDPVTYEKRFFVYGPEDGWKTRTRYKVVFNPETKRADLITTWEVDSYVGTEHKYEVETDLLYTIQKQMMELGWI